MKYSDNDVNTFYVYVTLRNLFYDQKKKQVPQVDINSLTNLAYEEGEYDKEALRGPAREYEPMHRRYALVQ